jgi:hypothetical protein
MRSGGTGKKLLSAKLMPISQRSAPGPAALARVQS